MKISKGQGVSLFSAFIIFGVLTSVVFLAPLAHTITFWLGYFFAVFALVAMVAVLVLYFANPVKEDKFLSLPAVKAVWLYYLLQSALSVWQMINFPMSYLPTLIMNLVLGGIFSILIVVLYVASRRIGQAEEYTSEKVLFIKRARQQLNSIESDNAEVAKRIEELSEVLRFSDPMSHSALLDLEGNICDTINELAENANDYAIAVSLCGQMEMLIKSRNDQCKMYKGVKDSVAAKKQSAGSGGGIAVAGAGAMLGLLLTILAVCFIVIPQGKYEYATDLLTDGMYNEAAEAFLSLGNYRDSEDKVEQIRILLLDEQCAAAQTLFDNGMYADAMLIYMALDGYKDSQGKIEEIYNRLSSGNIIYFGTYDSIPVAWQIIKKEDNKLLLLADKSVKQLPVHSELKTVEFEDSDLIVWLNKDFIANFTDVQMEKISAVEGAKVFLLNEAEATELKEAGIDLSSDSDWWIAEKSEDGFKYVSTAGEIVNEGDLAIREKGVRPAIWIVID